MNIFRKNPRFWQLFAITLCIIGFTYTYRSYIAAKETALAERFTGGDFVPYTIESGIVYSYIRMIADGNAPKYDPHLAGAGTQYTVEEQMSLGLERLLGNSIKLRRTLTGGEAVTQGDSEFEDNPAETRFMRRVLRWWISLIPAALFLALVSCGAPRLPAALCSLIYAVGCAALARYTGEDLLKGNFALPLLAFALAAQFGYQLHPRRWKLVALALCVYLAAANWDAAQLWFGIWGGIELIKSLFCHRVSRRRGRCFLVMTAALGLAAALSPYCRTHHLILSPTVMVIMPLAAVMNLIPLKRLHRGLLAGTVALVWAAAVWSSPYSADYGHFADLLIAKIEFANVKPADPQLLSFDQRYLWTPALQSVNSWREVAAVFPMALGLRPLSAEPMLGVNSKLLPMGCALILAALAVMIFFSLRRRGRRLAGMLPVAAMLAVYILLFWLFYRFHVFVALFAPLALGLALTPLYRRSGKAVRAGVVIALLLIFAVEVGRRSRLERALDPALVPITELVRYLRTEPFAGEVVLADMDISGVLKAYTNAGIIIQPKFELAPIRKLTEEYTTLLFDPDERNFAEWCYRNNIRFFIYSRGASDWSPEQAAGRENPAPHIYAPRYMAGLSGAPPSTSVAFKAEFAPDKLEFLHELEIPEQYASFTEQFRIFLVTSPEDIALAAFDAEESRSARREWDMESAQNLAEDAYYRAPSDETLLIYYEAFERLPESPSLKHYLKNN